MQKTDKYKELCERLDKLFEDVKKYATAEVTVCAATKTVSAEVINLAAEHGLTDIGENRVQELLEKYMALASNVVSPENNTEYPESIRKSGALQALYDNTGANEQLAQKLHAAILKSRQDHFRNNPVKENRIKKELFKILNDADEVERLFKIVIEQDEY